MPEVKKERSFWRDMSLSQRHRRWGWNCPAIDIDFLFLEYDKCKPSAIIEYKHESAPLQYQTNPSYQAIINLGNSADLPVFAVRYAGDFSWWRVIPLNKNAEKILPDRKEMNEKEYVTLLYKLRGYAPPEDIFQGWNKPI